MGTFVLFMPFEQKEGQQVYADLLLWFQKHPDRTDCKLDRGVVYRDTLKEDVEKLCVKGTILSTVKNIPTKYTVGVENKRKSKSKKKPKKRVRSRR